jgi:hypothetical protein
MAGHLPELHHLWTVASDAELAQLCRDYPGFYHYSLLMEQAAEAERRQPNPAIDFPPLPEPLRQALTTILTEAAELERGFQSVLDAGDRLGLSQTIAALQARHDAWRVCIGQLTAQLPSADMTPRAREFLGQTLEQMAERVGNLQRRAASLGIFAQPPKM